MFNRMITAVLATLVLFSASAQAQQPQQIRPAGKPAAWMAANGWDGTKVNQPDGRVRTDWFCGGNVQPDGSCKRGTISGPPNGSSVASASVGSRQPAPMTVGGKTFVTTQFSEVVEQGIRDRQINQRPTSAPQVAVQAPAQTSAQPFRVFTPGVNIETLAGAFKEGSESNVLNAPINEVEAAIARFSGVDVSPELLVKGALVDCQKAGVEGKHRVGVKSKQQMNGLKKFNFAVVGSELKDCQPGQKLYVVQDGNGKNVAIADSSGFLLGKAPTVAEIKVDR